MKYSGSTSPPSAAPSALVRPLEDLLAIFLRHPDQLGDHFHRKRIGETSWILAASEK